MTSTFSLAFRAQTVGLEGENLEDSEVIVPDGEDDGVDGARPPSVSVEPAAVPMRRTSCSRYLRADRRNAAARSGVA
jgi:hypothetical protein